MNRDADTGTLLDMYKTAVEMADRVSARRGTANTFFVTLNAALAAVVGIVTAARKPPPHGNLPSFDGFGLVVASASGVVLAAVWWALLRYYRRLSRAKWAVINRMETRLPAQPFTEEWQELRAEAAGPAPTRRGPFAGRVRLRVPHREATVVEQWVPFVFIVLYVILGIRAVVQ